MFLKNSSIALGRDLNKLRRSIFLLVLFLNLFGILIIYDASAISSWQLYNDPMYYLKRQAVYSIIGYLCFFLSLGIDLDKYKKYLPAIVGTGIFLLVIVLVPGIGKKMGGARRWLQLFGWKIQPSEIFKVLYITYAAFCFSVEKPKQFFQKKSTLAGLFFLSCVLLILEPDLGMVLFLFMFSVAMLFVNGFPIKKIVIPFAVGVCALAALIAVSPYRRARIISFLNPWSDYEGKGFQVIQSQIGFGRGGIIGTGLGGSIQRLFFLPAAYTDFIYSIIGEEFGIVGSWGVLALFFVIIYYGNILRRNIADPFRSMLALGILCMFVFEIIMNMGVSIGIFPTKGLPLPFVSYGGSAIVMNFIALGLLFNASK